MALWHRHSVDVMNSFRFHFNKCFKKLLGFGRYDGVYTKLCVPGQTKVGSRLLPTLGQTTVLINAKRSFTLNSCIAVIA